MKIVDLINDIANNKAPKKIRFKGGLYEFDEIQKDYVDIDREYLFCNQFMIGKILNDEVEIIEKNKEIEEINVWYEFDGKNNDEIIYHMCTELKDKINELIKAVNELKKGK